MTSLLDNSRRADIRFYPNGRIDIAANLAKFLQLASGDVIDIAHQNGEFYLYVRYRANQYIGRHEATAYPTKKGIRSSNNFRAYSKKLCSVICGICNCTDAKLALFAGQPLSMPIIGNAIPLITLNPQIQK